VSRTERAFVAVPLAPGLRARLSAATSALRREDWADGVSWVKEENLHLTLRFLGETPVEVLPRVARAVAEAVAPLAPFEARVGVVDVFPGRRRPRAIAASVDGGPDLVELAAAVERGVVSAGLPATERPFSRAHITLGRVRRRAHGRPIVGIDFEPAVLAVDSLVLYTSELKPTGAVYSELERLPLSGRRASD